MFNKYWLNQVVIRTIFNNKIVISEQILRTLYKKYGAKKISEKLDISKQTVLRNLHEYNIELRKSGSPSKLPEYWKNALRVPKSTSAWSKGQTKETNKSLMQLSKSLSGKNNGRWKPEIHTGEQIECNCGCGQLIDKHDKKGRKRFWKVGHCSKGHFKMGQTAGKKSNNWKGGVSSKNDSIRKTAEYKNWRLNVYKKNKYICQDCRKKTKNLVAHHIKSFSKFIELRFDINNGITLCRSCHLKRHRLDDDYDKEKK